MGRSIYQRFTSKAFRRGLVAGLASPSVYLTAKPRSFRRRPIDTVAMAWADVGRELSSTLASELRITGRRDAAIVKTDGKATTVDAG